MNRKVIPAGRFKQGCLAILDEVADGQLEVVVTKRGRPVARIISVEDAGERERSTLARLRGRIRGSIGRETDLVAPTSTVARWKLMPRKRA
ncbi:MAG TPA: type II toxin-antitoxin system Phd/YefM family antitoxin [Polyangiaceae bacterium]|nr:type II toxin-antitoxin system Phd/YefM family antitoxin [Polyangiaceae bacterium]